MVIHTILLMLLVAFCGLFKLRMRHDRLLSWGMCFIFTYLFYGYCQDSLHGLQGFSLLFFAAQRFNVGRVLLIVITIVIVMSGILTQVLAFVGLFDMYFDYRRRFGGSYYR